LQISKLTLDSNSFSFKQQSLVRAASLTSRSKSGQLTDLGMSSRGGVCCKFNVLVCTFQPSETLLKGPKGPFIGLADMQNPGSAVNLQKFKTFEFQTRNRVGKFQETSAGSDSF